MTDVRQTGLNVFRELVPGLLPDGDADLHRGGFADEFLEISLDNVFGRLWGRDGLSRRDRQQDRRRDSERLTVARGPRGCATAREMRRVAEQTRTLAERAEPPGGIEPPTYSLRVNRSTD